MDLEDYIAEHIDPQPPHLRELERQTNLRRVNGRMCSGHIQGRILKMLTRMIRPERVLELGTFTGYSAICIAEGLEPGATLVTIELEDELEEVIEEALERSGQKDKVSLRIGDALTVCREYPDAVFDMIFIDADKREYPAYFREAARLLREGGYIIADNILWDGHVADPERHDPQTDGIREYNRLVAGSDEFEVVILPVRDGISVARKRGGSQN